MNVYIYYHGGYRFYFEGKWRSSRTLALMLKRRHTPEAWFINIDSGRGLGFVVGSWDWTAADWAKRGVDVSHTLFVGSVLDLHEHTWLDGKCPRCGMFKDLHDKAQGALA